MRARKREGGERWVRWGQRHFAVASFSSSFRAAHLVQSRGLRTGRWRLRPYRPVTLHIPAHPLRRLEEADLLLAVQGTVTPPPDSVLDVADAPKELPRAATGGHLLPTELSSLGPPQVSPHGHGLLLLLL